MATSSESPCSPQSGRCGRRGLAPERRRCRRGGGTPRTTPTQSLQLPSVTLVPDLVGLAQASKGSGFQLRSPTRARRCPRRKPHGHRLLGWKTGGLRSAFDGSWRSTRMASLLGHDTYGGMTYRNGWSGPSIRWTQTRSRRCTRSQSVELRRRLGPWIDKRKERQPDP